MGRKRPNVSISSEGKGGVKATTLNAAYTNPDGEEIDIIGGLVDLVSSSTPLQLPASADELDLTTLILYELRLSYAKTGAASSYGIKGSFAWKPSLNLDSDTIAPFEVGAQLDLRKSNAPNSKVLGTVCGDIQSTIEGLDFLSLGVCYELADPNTANERLSLTIGKITFVAVYQNSAGNLHLEFSTKTEGQLTLGEVITFLVSLVDPSIDEFEFDPPWNFITEFNLARLLESLLITVDLTRQSTDRPREKRFGIMLGNLGGLVPSALSALIKPTALGLEFVSTQVGGKFQKRTNIKIIGEFLGRNQNLSWDPLNDAPPEIPGQGASVFELRYLGLGQHIAF